MPMRVILCVDLHRVVRPEPEILQDLFSTLRSVYCLQIY